MSTVICHLLSSAFRQFAILKVGNVAILQAIILLVLMSLENVGCNSSFDAESIFPTITPHKPDIAGFSLRSL